MSIVLIGYRGSGKSTVGRMLAERLGHPFVDIDDLIVRDAGKTIRDIFEKDGETAFRDRETATLGEVIERPDHIIGLGGGTLEREENRRLVRAAGHRIIYLRCDPAELHRRVQQDPRSRATRPSLTTMGGGIEEIRAMVARREPFYSECAHASLDVTSLTPEEVVSHVTRLLALDSRAER